MAEIEAIKQAVAQNPLPFYGRYLEGLSRDGEGRMKALCPFHADGDASLKINLTGEHAGRFHCFGCHADGDFIDFVARKEGLQPAQAIELTAQITSTTTERQSKPKHNHQEPKRYEIRDADGTLLATHCRIDVAPGEKKIWWEPKGVKPPTIPLWNIAAVLAADPAVPVVVAEGEKACDALTAAGQLAVGTYGTGAMPSETVLQPLIGRNVILWPDNDPKGREHADAIAARLIELGCPPYFVEWAEAPPKGDAANFLETRGAQELQEFLAGAVPYAVELKPAEPALIMPVTFAELEDMVSATSWIWPGYLPNGAISILFAPPEAGKSYTGLDILRCLATGSDWPDGAANEHPPTKCLLIDYEGTQAEYLDRAKGYGIPLDMLLTLPPDLTPPYLTDPKSFDAFRSWLEHTGAGFMLIDSWRDGAPGVNEDKSTEVAPTLTPLKLIARDFNIPILLLHHATKKGASWTMTMADARGSGAFGAGARLMLAIDKPNANSEARLLRVVKRNTGPKPAPLGFEFGPDNEDSTPGGIIWTDPVYRHRRTPKMDAAKLAIYEALRRQPMLHKELRAVLEAADVKKRTGDDALAMMKETGQVMQGADGRYGLVSPRD